MRASLASATSLLALLLLEGREAVAAPIITAGRPTPFYYVLGDTAQAGTDTAPNAAESYIFTPLTTGVASTANGTYSSTSYVLAGQALLAKLIASNSLTTNSSDADLAIVRVNRRQSGTVNTGNSVFVGTNANSVLLDGPSALPSTASASFGYTIPALAAAKTATTDVGGDDRTKPDESQPAIGRNTGTAVGKPDKLPVYTYNPLGGGTVASPTTKAPQPAVPSQRIPDVARAFSDSAPGASVFDVRNPAVRSSPAQTSPRISSSAVNAEAVKAFILTLQQPTRGDVAQVTLTAGGYKTAVADISSFTVSSWSDGSTVIPGAIVPVPLPVVGTGGGELPSSLTVFTAESTALDGYGGPFTYPFD